ncbi:hypothetical protein F5884DRAFT_249185 [Xylogone sp. PMI_703]|nr:hypothetical protein F5884DRAFT_249185 [Xylogone sp. PMI_703]
MIPRTIWGVIALPITFAQWIYPPPLPSGKTLSDYASGADSSNITYSAGDSIFGSFEPAEVELYILYRCAQPPVKTPIYPSNLSISSSDPVVGSDGTWEWPWTYVSSAFTNAYTPGQDILFFSGIPNPKTSGSLCWFELSTGTDVTNQQPPFNRSITLNGSDATHHFVTMPFNVGPAAAVNTTWTTGGQNASDVYPNGVNITLSGGTLPTSTASGSQPSGTPNAASNSHTHIAYVQTIASVIMAISLLTF